LQDLEDTTGSWELYGTDDNRRYPSLQNEFFERASAPLTRRESALAFIFTGGELAFLCSAVCLPWLGAQHLLTHNSYCKLITLFRRLRLSPLAADVADTAIQQ